MDQTEKDMARARKSQKNVWLDNDLIDWIDQQQSSTGATITRIISAALLDYFFEHPEGPNDWWMKQIVAIEKGDLGFWNVPIERAQLRINMAKAAIRRARKAGASEDELTRLEGVLVCEQEVKESYYQAGFEDKPDPSKIPSAEAIESRRVSPEELAQMPEPQDDADDNS